MGTIGQGPIPSPDSSGRNEQISQNKPEQTAEKTGAAALATIEEQVGKVEGPSGKSWSAKRITLNDSGLKKTAINIGLQRAAKTLPKGSSAETVVIEVASKHPQTLNEAADFAIEAASIEEQKAAAQAEIRESIKEGAGRVQENKMDYEDEYKLETSESEDVEVEEATGRDTEVEETDTLKKDIEVSNNKADDIKDESVKEQVKTANKTNALALAALVLAGILGVALIIGGLAIGTAAIMSGVGFAAAIPALLMIGVGTAMVIGTAAGSNVMLTDMIDGTRDKFNFAKQWDRAESADDLPDLDEEIAGQVMPEIQNLYTAKGQIANQEENLQQEKEQLDKNYNKLDKMQEELKQLKGSDSSDQARIRHLEEGIEKRQSFEHNQEKLNGMKEDFNQQFKLIKQKFGSQRNTVTIFKEQYNPMNDYVKNVRNLPGAHGR